MSTDRLRYLAAVVETKNLRKAAALVGISAPSMSKAMSVLTQELGVELIRAEGRGIELTEHGLAVYRAALPLLEEERRFYSRVQTQKETPSRLRIASFEVFSSYFIAHFLESNPELEVLVLEKTPGLIEQAILSGLVDVGLTYVPAVEKDLEFIEVGTFRMGLFGLSKWRTQSFEKWPFAVPTTELRVHSSDADALDLWPRRAPPRFVKYQFELLETALQTSRAGLSVLHCPDFIVALQNRQTRAAHQLASLPAPPGYRAPKAQKIYLVCRKGAAHRRLEGKLAKALRSLAPG